ncbi:MAG: pitrilysin family protein, partial [Kofleriaceae bacterium]|nr:pitrilysin family protein [Kofleriaceae bacterium]
GDAQGAPLRVPVVVDTLPNGLVLIIHEDRTVPVVTTNVWYHVGSGDEKLGRTGFAHLFEHLMFMGSKNAPYPQFDRLLEAAGANNNGSTNGDRTNYYESGPASSLPLMLWLEADRLGWMLETMDAPKVDLQRDVVKNERRQSYENQPYGMAELLIQEALWPKDHGYHWSTIGYPADLKAANVTDVASFFRTYYVPNNATMVIAGDVKFADVKRLVEKYFTFIPKASEPARPQYKTPAPITKEVVLTTTDDVQVPRVYLNWRGPAAFTPEEPALDALALILGDGKSSRLYKRMVYDEKIAQGVGASFQGEQLAGMFQIVATAKPGVDPKRLTAVLNEEIAKIAATPPTDAELERAKNSQEAGFLNGLEPTLQRAIQLASYDVQAKDPDYFAKDLARRRAVTAQQVQAAAAKYLKQSARVTLTINPGKKPQEKK